MKIDLMKIITYDFSNLNLQENSVNNCFGCDSCNCDCNCDSCDTCDCNCDCDSGDCDSNNYCDNDW